MGLDITGPRNGECHLLDVRTSTCYDEVRRAKTCGRGGRPMETVQEPLSQDCYRRHCGKEESEEKVVPIKGETGEYRGGHSEIIRVNMKKKSI